MTLPLKDIFSLDPSAGCECCDLEKLEFTVAQAFLVGCLVGAGISSAEEAGHEELFGHRALCDKHKVDFLAVAQGAMEAAQEMDDLDAGESTEKPS